VFANAILPNEELRRISRKAGFPSLPKKNPAIAIAIAQATFPGEKLVTATVLLELVVVTLISVPYISYIKREVRERSALDAGSSQTRLGSARTTYLVDRRARR